MSNAIADNIAHIQGQIADCCALNGRAAHEVMLLAVSKTVNAQAVLQAAMAGQRRFGENYVQEGVEKILALQALCPDTVLEWHAIGPLQSNKTKMVATYFDWVHSIDHIKTAQRLSHQRPTHLAPLQVLIQLNVDNAPSKAGVRPEDALTLALAIRDLPQMTLRGLMSMPDAATPESMLHLHEKARLTLMKINAHPAFSRQALDTLSMGMSADLPIAIAAGATMVRVGSAIFGARHNPNRRAV